MKKMKKNKNEKIPTTRETIYLCSVVQNAYFSFDQEDYCYTPQNLFKKNGKCDCYGCHQYKKLIRAYKIADKFIPKK